MRLGRQRDDHVASAQRRGKAADEARARRVLRSDDPDHPGRLGDGEVEVGPLDRVHVPGELRALVCPAPGPDNLPHRWLPTPPAPPTAATHPDVLPPTPP